jgi:hypothetical protein
MDTKMIFRWTLVILILLTFSLGCKLATGISQAIAIATQVDIEGLATEVDIEGLATKVDIEGLATEIDIESLPTKVDLKSLMTEVGSYATEIDMGAFETENSVMATQMSAMSTEIGLGNLITQMPALQGTLAVFATPSGFPADIPLLEGERSFIAGSANQLQYAARAKIPEAVEFYRREMALRGWVEGSGSRVLDNVAVLKFQRGNRTVTVTVTEDFFLGVLVSIIIEG